MAPAKRHPLRVHLLIVFLIGLFAASGSLILINFIMERNAGLKVSLELMKAASTGIGERTHRLFREIQTFVQTASSVRILAQPVETSRPPFKAMLTEALSALPEVDGVYVGYADGSFFYLVNLEKSDRWRRRLRAPKMATRAVRVIRHVGQKGLMSQWTFLNKRQEVIKEGPLEPPSYDPRTRPWFKAALSTDGLAWTEPYIFDTTDQIGITISRKITGEQAVIGVDVTLDELADFLDSQKVSASSLAFIFDRHGHLIVHSNLKDIAFNTKKTAHGESQIITIADSQDPILTAMGRRLEERGWGNHDSFRFDVDGREYAVFLTKLPEEIGEGLYLSIAAPVDELTVHVDQIVRASLIVSAVVVVVFIPLVIWASASMSRALHQLAKQAEKLADLNGDVEPPVPSRVKEIFVLAEAMHASRIALGVFGRYVPRALVRRVVQSGKTPTMGGERRSVTLMFTDIEGFTTITEATEAEVLMERLSRYFSGISAIVHAHGGTINKYIGDAVMAMWNVPETQEDHVALACRAALEIKQFLTHFNQDQVLKGNAPFITRIGLHSGMALVGHLGDSDHIEYTALGDTVNIAARLEGLNKEYGTSILVSDVVVDRIRGRFGVSFVASVTPKGRRSDVKIYSLDSISDAEYPV